MRRVPQNSSKDGGRDLCQTPDYALDPIVPYLYAMQERLGRQLIVWEPAAGEGLLVGYLRDLGFAVVAGDILTGQDYFLDSSEPEAYDIQLTNVPFSKKVEWMRRAACRSKAFALLMPSVTMFNRGGALVVAEFGIEIVAPLRRIDYKMPNIGWGEGKRKSTAQFHSSWYTRGFQIGQRLTQVELIKRKQRGE